MSLQDEVPGIVSECVMCVDVEGRKAQVKAQEEQEGQEERRREE